MHRAERRMKTLPTVEQRLLRLRLAMTKERLQHLKQGGNSLLRKQRKQHFREQLP